MEIRIKVITGARKESILQSKDGRLLVSVKAPREEGKANDRVRELVAEYFSVAPSEVQLIRGKTQSGKTLKISSLRPLE
jgi:uncharacterized protein (TIGR00251 family)